MKTLSQESRLPPPSSIAFGNCRRQLPSSIAFVNCFRQLLLSVAVVKRRVGYRIHCPINRRKATGCLNVYSKHGMKQCCWTCRMTLGNTMVPADETGKMMSTFTGRVAERMKGFFMQRRDFLKQAAGVAGLMASGGILSGAVSGCAGGRQLVRPA
jgi:hypothetical protein